MTWQETDPHTHTYTRTRTYLSSEVQWATSVQSRWLPLSAAQPSPVLTHRIPVSLPEETLASFTSAWEVSPAVFGFLDRASVTCCFRYKRGTRPYHMNRKFNISFGIIWLHWMKSLLLHRWVKQGLCLSCSCCSPSWGNFTLFKFLHTTEFHLGD